MHLRHLFITSYYPIPAILAIVQDGDCHERGRSRTIDFDRNRPITRFEIALAYNRRINSHA